DLQHRYPAPQVAERDRAAGTHRHGLIVSGGSSFTSVPQVLSNCSWIRPFTLLSLARLSQGPLKLVLCRLAPVRSASSNTACERYGWLRSASLRLSLVR